MKKSTFKITLALFAIVGSLIFLNSCEKDVSLVNESNSKDECVIPVTVNAVQNESITQVLTVANIRALSDGVNYKVMFNKNAEIFDLSDASILAQLRQAFNSKKQIKVTFNPWMSKIEKITALSAAEIEQYKSILPKLTKGISININASVSADELDNVERLGVINTTSPSTGLTNVIPDMATAQLMFNYLTKQCCALSGPYGVDYCISFQYAEDGCYARAHKMCYVLNNKYHYSTHKIFSFANSGSDVLSVQAQKWGGCCINWWYHVAPLVNIKTTTGVKAFVFDPAMFDQPVLLSVWLHAQKNPACAGTPGVSMINIQPTDSYAPADYTGYAFVPDPSYSDTNSTLVAYSNLVSCP